MLCSGETEAQGERFAQGDLGRLVLVPWCVGICSHHQPSCCKPIAINPAAMSCLFSALPIFSAPIAALERHLELGWSHGQEELWLYVSHVQGEQEQA